MDALAVAAPGGRKPGREERIGIASLLLAAGRDTVIGLVAGIGGALAARPDLLPLLHAVGPWTAEGTGTAIDARDRFIEEVLRLTSDLVMERIDRGPEPLPLSGAPHGPC